ncbi:hypothetical protein ACHAWF_007018 [Thalassiosira exigua]
MASAAAPRARAGGSPLDPPESAAEADFDVADPPTTSPTVPSDAGKKAAHVKVRQLPHDVDAPPLVPVAKVAVSPEAGDDGSADDKVCVRFLLLRRQRQRWLRRLPTPRSWSLIHHPMTMTTTNATTDHSTLSRAPCTISSPPTSRAAASAVGGQDHRPRHLPAPGGRGEMRPRQGPHPYVAVDDAPQAHEGVGDARARACGGSGGGGVPGRTRLPSRPSEACVAPRAAEARSDTEGPQGMRGVAGPGGRRPRLAAAAQDTPACTERLLDHDRLGRDDGSV